DRALCSDRGGGLAHFRGRAPKRRNEIVVGAAPAKLWWVQLLLNFLWSPIFFAAHLPGLALAVALLLLAAILGFIFLSWKRDRVAALLFLPYAAWLAGGPVPTTVRDGVLRADRLRSMRTRVSAAYKGIHALLMQEGAKDFRTGQTF